MLQYPPSTSMFGCGSYRVTNNSKANRSIADRRKHTQQTHRAAHEPPHGAALRHQLLRLTDPLSLYAAIRDIAADAEVRNHRILDQPTPNRVLRHFVDQIAPRLRITPRSLSLPPDSAPAASDRTAALPATPEWRRRAWRASSSGSSPRGSRSRWRRQRRPSRCPR